MPNKSPPGPDESAVVYDQVNTNGCSIVVVNMSISHGPLSPYVAPVQAGTKLAGSGLTALPPVRVSVELVMTALPPEAPVRFPVMVVVHVPGANGPVKPMIVAFAGSAIDK